MQIENDLVVKIGDGELVFGEPGLNDLAFLHKLGEMSPEEQAAFIFSKVKELRGFTYKDGQPVTVESLRERPVPAKFFGQVTRAWAKGIVDALNGEAEAKNE